MAVNRGRRDALGCALSSNLERVIADRHVHGDVVQRDRFAVAARKGHLHLDEQRALTVNPEGEPLESCLDLLALRPHVDEVRAAHRGVGFGPNLEQ